MTESTNIHGNSKESEKEQHLYEILNSQTNEIMKYGISGSQLNKDGTSKRANQQVNKMNKLFGAIIYIAVVLYTKIKNRKKALKLEQKLVNEYGKTNEGNAPKIQKRPKVKEEGSDN